MKYLAFYLPQFHEIPENNDAWGHGFTEWTNVKQSKPLFLGHNQPRIPLNDNYYDLLDVNVMKWQAELADKYGIDGFACYHYWFNGRMVLEKPLQNILNNPEIPFHFCFAWANEPWTKTWHGAGGNKEIMIAQTYGGKDEWKNHYDYFRDFFLDNRYLKKENKPILLIYRLRNIPEFNRMIVYWNDRARKDGFDGIYLISMNVAREHVERSMYVNGCVDFEPNNTKYKLGNIEPTLKPKNKKTILWNRYALKSLNYEEINRAMIAEEHEKGHYRTAFVDYDDSPRRHERAIITKGSSPAKFGRYLYQITENSIEEGNDIVFINAWNEWGEGNYLEPDVKNKYKYLEEIRKIKSTLLKGD